MDLQITLSAPSLLFQFKPCQVQQVEGDAVEHVGIECWFDEGHQGTDHGGDTTQPEEMFPRENWE